MADWPVIGHEWAVDLLQRALIGDRLSHAYLFVGPSQVGKRTLALALAQALLCTENAPGGSLAGAGRPCGVCRGCRLVAQGHHPDLRTITAERNAIQIDQIRALQAEAALSPLEGRFRIFILREIERATAPAANALLKTLEEAPPRVVLLLTSARRDQVLPTIVSRCQPIVLRPLPEAKVREALSGRWEPPAERAMLLARLSSGRLGWAVAAHVDPSLWEERARRLADLLQLGSQSAVARLAYSEALSRQGDAVEATLGLWATWWRDLMLMQGGAGKAIVNLDHHRQLEQEAGLYRPDQVSAALADVLQARRRIAANVNLRLALDVLTLRLPRPGGSQTALQPAAPRARQA
jgi:DNA polymerase III subunit delta'